MGVRADLEVAERCVEGDRLRWIKPSRCHQKRAEHSVRTMFPAIGCAPGFSRQCRCGVRAAVVTEAVGAVSALRILTAGRKTRAGERHKGRTPGEARGGGPVPPGPQLVPASLGGGDWAV